MSTSQYGTMPAGLARSLEGLAAVAALLTCIDEGAWGSLARPHAGGLAVLVGRLHEELAVEISALVVERPPG